jgi:hypothetical protein
MSCPNGHQVLDLLLMAPVEEVVVELEKKHIVTIVSSVMILLFMNKIQFRTEELIRMTHDAWCPRVRDDVGVTLHDPVEWEWPHICAAWSRYRGCRRR